MADPVKIRVYDVAKRIMDAGVAGVRKLSSQMRRLKPSESRVRGVVSRGR